MARLPSVFPSIFLSAPANSATLARTHPEGAVVISKNRPNPVPMVPISQDVCQGQLRHHPHFKKTNRLAHSQECPGGKGGADACGAARCFCPPPSGGGGGERRGMRPAMKQDCGRRGFGTRICPQQRRKRFCLDCGYCPFHAGCCNQGT